MALSKELTNYINNLKIEMNKLPIKHYVHSRNRAFLFRCLSKYLFNEVHTDNCHHSPQLNKISLSKSESFNSDNISTMSFIHL